jgi:ribonucleoside-diphosphate reductase alpha chain
MQKYTREQVFAESLKYFNGDELAASTFFKYVLQDKHQNFYELTPDDMHHRLAGEFARIESAFGGSRQLSEEEIYGLFSSFRYIVPQGSPMSGIGNNFINVSLSNCVVARSPEDNMSSIMETGRDLANLFKRRAGVGLDLSNLRPDGSPVNNSAGSSTGAWSFADYYSNVCRMVGQNNRRGALILSLDVRHPDIFKFVKMKQDLKKVTGANVSVKLTDAFMKAVRDNEKFLLHFPVGSANPTFVQEIMAVDLWNSIVDSATRFAEPGLLMWDTILKWLPAEIYADQGFKTISVNPCGELPLSADDSCRLISQNLKWYVSDPFTAKARFDLEKLQAHTKIAQRLSDDLVELELEKLNNLVSVAETNDEKELFGKLLASCKKGRRTGLGTFGLADAFARMRLRYASNEAIALAEDIYRIRKNASYEESADLAKERGAFPVWSWEKEKDHPFIRSLDASVLEKIKSQGRRNISNLTNAPTGSVAIIAQASSGMGPVYENEYTRRKKKNHDEAFDDSDYVDDLGDHFQEFRVVHKNAQEYCEMMGVTKLPEFFVESGDVNWQQAVSLQSVLQKHIDHSISVTINLPTGTPASVVGDIYFTAWEKGLKGITVYVDGSRSGILVDKKPSVKYIDAVKRPNDLDCDIHQVSIKGEKWCIFVGLLEGKPYEVFGGLSNSIEIAKEYKKGTIVKGAEFKAAPNRYDLKLNGFVIKNITKQFDNANYQVLTRMVSLGLRHGAKPSFLVEQLQKDPDNDFSSFSKVLARVLKKYILDGTKAGSDRTCPECKTESLQYQEGCIVCVGCGYSRCG